MSRYLVTGGCGFIGSHLTDELLKLGHTVLVLDNLSTGKKANLNKEAELIVGDICDKDIVAKTLCGCDGCFHLAAIPSVQESVKRWVETHHTNLVGMINLLDVATRLHYDRGFGFTYASSAAVYAEDNCPPFKESDKVSPISPYGVDKLSCEMQARIAGKLHHLPNVGLRIFNVFGERQNPDSAYSGVISNFINKFKNKEEVVIYGDGGQIRDFIYVKDVVAHFVSAMEHAAIESPVYNACSGKGTTLNELVHILEEIFRLNLKIAHTKPQTGDLRESIGDDSLARLVLRLREKDSLITNLALLSESL